MPVVSLGQGQGGAGTGGTMFGGALSGGTSAGTAQPSAASILANDIKQDATPTVPAGAYDYGSGKVYNAFTVEDVVEGGTQRVTRGLWSGNVAELSTFFTSSYQSSTQKQYYYEIYNGIPSASTSEPQFAVAYGHRLGSGSYGQNEDSPSKAIYSQFQQILLPSNQRTFTFGGVTQDDVYVIAINRARLKDKLDPGNWELQLSGSNGRIMSLVDDSGDVNQTGVSSATSYNVVSGSLLNGVYSTGVYGAVYPQQGIIVLSAAKLDASCSLNTERSASSVTASLTGGEDRHNHRRLFTAISGAAVESANNGFQARNEEEVKSTFFFVRAKNAEYNFSNNPSFVTGSNGQLKQQTFVGDPKVYITQVGLYNNDNQLLAIAKLSKPILKSFSNEILIKVKLDF